MTHARVQALRMDDATAARRWHIEFRLRVIERAIERQSQRRLAMVAVGLTVGGSAAIARATQAVGTELLTVILLTCAAGVVAQLLELRYLEGKHREAGAAALAEADSLMTPGGEPGDDGPPEGP